MTAGANFPLPVDTPAMEAKLADEIPSDGMQWQYEPKRDGFRFLAFVLAKRPMGSLISPGKVRHVTQ